MTRGRTSTYRRFEERHPDLWDEVQAMIESDDCPHRERAEAPSIFARLFRSSDIFATVSCARREREEPPMTTAQQCRVLAAQARVKSMVVSADESDAYLAIAREYEEIAAAMEAAQGEVTDDRGTRPNSAEPD